MTSEKHFNDIAVEIVEEAETYAKLIAEPFERGYATTIGNSLRRILMTSVPGAAITSIKIDGVQHEYSTIPHVKEDVLDILLNIKAIHLKALSDRPGKLRLEIQGEGRVCAGDIMTSPNFEIVNPELHLLSNLLIKVQIQCSSSFPNLFVWHFPE